MKKVHWLLCALCCFSGFAAPVRVTPINEAEAVVAPFWDYMMHEKKNWNIREGQAKDAFVQMTFSMMPRFVIERSLALDATGYDQFLIGAMMPPCTTLRAILDTDAGRREKLFTGVKNIRDEYVMPLDGAKTINKIVLEFTAGTSGLQGVLSWIGLVNQKNLAGLLERQKRFAAQPLELFLNNNQPSFTGRVNLLAAPAALKELQDDWAKKNAKMFERDFDSYIPEKGLAPVLPYANPAIFGRVRDGEKDPFKSVRFLLVKGLIARDAALLRSGVRTAVVIALTPNWDSTFFSEFPDSGWDQRVFSHAVAAEYVALALDYGHDILTEAGRSLLEKRLALDGLGWINQNVWRYSYLFGNNQFSVFSRGRIPAYLVLEKARGWNGGRIRPYTELAVNELFDSIKRLIHPDGSFLEGPGYFFYTVGSFRPALEAYANARGKDLSELLPAELQSLGAFADTFISTDRRGGLIPFSSGQGEGRHGGAGEYIFLATIAPSSQWTTLANRYRNRFLADPAALAGIKRVPEVNPEIRSIASLPVMGALASTRKWENRTVKMLLLGTSANCRSHRHNDKGSFVLEVGGDTFAADPGGQCYADADAKMVIRADYHNLLVPMKPRINEEATVSPTAITVKGEGDATRFQARVSPASAADGAFSHWDRSVTSDTPDHFIIRDRYKTADGQGVRSLWMTPLPWRKESGNTIRIDGENAYAVIRYPADCVFSAENVVVRGKEHFTRLNFAKKQSEGELILDVTLYPKNAYKK